MMVLAHTDGASRGNPGDSGIGVVLRSADGQDLASISGYIGMTTNNQAEYRALLECLRAVEQLPCRHLTVHSDSELMVRQLNGQYKVRDAQLKKSVQTVREILARAPFRFEIRHVVREENAEADALANEGIDLRRPVKVEWHDAARLQLNVK